MSLVLRYLFNPDRFSLLVPYIDPRTAHLPLVGSPIPVILIMVTYLFVVKLWGPKFMENRPPYKLKKILQYYNGFQVIINIMIFVMAIKNSYIRSDFSWSCQGIDTTIQKPYIDKLLLAGYLYYLVKIIDLLDTIFFVLRKKNNQITFLHVYHHCGMIFATYIFIKFLTGSHPTLTGVINSFVHIFMYSYYLLTSIDSSYLNSSKWKKHITQMQIIQFGILTVHQGLPLVIRSCNMPQFLSGLTVIQNIYMLTLFGEFYYKTYIKKSNKLIK